MKKFILTFLILASFGNLRSFDEYLGYKGSKLDNGKDFNTVRSEMLQKVSQTFKSKFNVTSTKDSQIMDRYLNIVASRAVFFLDLAFAMTPGNINEAYYILKGKDILQALEDGETISKELILKEFQNYFINLEEQPVKATKDDKINSKL